MTAPKTAQNVTSEIEELLDAGEPAETKLLAALQRVLGHFDCAVGTIHGIDPASGMLTLRAQVGVPAGLLDRVRIIPIGKGMAGLAAERRQAVQVCNLQTDNSGMAKPAARETRMEGSIAVPILVEGELRGVLGVAKPVSYTFSESESKDLESVALPIGRFLREGSK
jgi:putative methionine-R-sulfoxide reductase with GAF domain